MGRGPNDPMRNNPPLRARACARLASLAFTIALVFGCNDETSEPLPPDAAVVDAAADIETCEGRWLLHWTCIDCPRGATNPLQYSDRLDVAGTLLTYSSSHGCIECGAIHIGERVGTCIAIPDDNGEQRSQYQLCPTTGGVEAAIEWSGYPGPPAPRRWRLSGTRL